METVAILLATYNGETYLPDLLNSLCAQTYQDFICYIHDDGSTDNTCAIIQDYSNQYPTTFRVVPGPPTGGAKANFLYLLRTVGVQYPYVMFCDQDDVWLPEKIQASVQQMKHMETDKEIPCLAYCDMKVVDEGLNMIAESFLDYNQLSVNCITLDRAIMKSYAAGCSMILNQSLAKSAAIDSADKIVMHDWWVLIVAAAIGKIERLPKPLLLYRQHQGNALGAQRITRWSRAGQILRRCLTFEQYAVTKKGLYVCLEQLSQCKNIPKLYKEKKKLIDGAIHFSKMSKAQKCRYILENGLYQNEWSKIWTCICS